MSWYTNQATPDLDKMAPIFVHIDRCRDFRKFDLRLDGHYTFKFNRTKDGSAKLEVSPNENFLGLFDEDKINLNVLCGINGVGKTTILKLLSGRLPTGSGKFVMVLGDGEGNYWANEPITIQDHLATVTLQNAPLWMDVSLSVLCANHVLDGDDTFSIHRKIAQHYITHRSLYDDRGNPHFTHLIVDFWELSERVGDIVAHLRRHLGWNLDTYDAENFLKSRPVLLTFLNMARDNTFDRFFVTMKNRGDVTDLPSMYAAMEGLDADGGLERKIIEFIGDPNVRGKLAKAETAAEIFARAEALSKAHPIRSFSRLSRQLYKLSDELHQEIDRFVHTISLDHPWHLWRENGLYDVFYLCPFKETRSGRRFLWNLSSGEFMDIANRYRLEPCMMQTDSNWIYWDEPDLHLHPEWKRQFIARFLKAVRATRKYLAKVDKRYRHKRYTIVLTTHSPFLLSDVTNDHAILLDRGRGNRTIVRGSHSGTFAGNIGAMFYDQFFMNETIGMYAESRIKKLIARIESKRALSPEEMAKCLRVFQAVGDELLRKLLLSKLAEKSGETN